MTDRLRIRAIIGSLRRESINRAVFRTAAELAEGRAELTEIDLASVPLSNGDVEADGDPPPVAALKSAVGEADGLVLFTPEYNRSMPAVTKNAIDWLSRFPGESVLSTARVGIVASTAGRHDAPGVRADLAKTVSVVTPMLHEPTLGLGWMTSKVDNGLVVDDEARTELAGWLDGFIDYLQETKHG